MNLPWSLTYGSPSKSTRISYRYSPTDMSVSFLVRVNFTFPAGFKSVPCLLRISVPSPIVSCSVKIFNVADVFCCVRSRLMPSSFFTTWLITFRCP